MSVSRPMLSFPAFLARMPMPTALVSLQKSIRAKATLTSMSTPVTVWKSSCTETRQS